jgi:hypothetical protein
MARFMRLAQLLASGMPVLEHVEFSEEAGMWGFTVKQGGHRGVWCVIDRY